MNKQELIKKYEHIYEVSHRPFVDGGLFSRGEDSGSARCSFEIIEDLKQLDEPQKVKVPECAEQWIEGHCAPSDVVNLFIEVTCAADSDGFIDSKWRWSTDFYEWLANDADTLYILCDALRYGYEVEEEPKWVVQVGNLYFCGWEDTTAQFVMNTMLGEEELIIKYKNEGTASAVAKNLGGTVEKV